MPRSRSSLPVRKMLPGVHRVRVSLAAGRAEYWYAWRGGPRILAVQARSDAELDALLPAQVAGATELYNKAVKPPPPPDLLESLIVAFLASPDFAGLGARHKADLQRYMIPVRKRWSALPLEALKAEGMRKAALDWRDSYGATPKTADAYLGALARVLSWGKERGDIPVNPLEKAPRIYKANRAEAIWTKPQLIALLKGRPAEFRRAVLLAAFTGLRLGDLVGLAWADVGENAITIATNKSKGRTIVVLPITPKVRAILKQIGRKDVGAVLTHSRGMPWTEWGLQTAMQRAKKDAGITGLRFHDLRGTAATHLIRAGVEPADVAIIMGWETKRVMSIARRYVTAEAVAAGMLERLRRNRR
jgi:integrase